MEIFRVIDFQSYDFFVVVIRITIAISNMDHSVRKPYKVQCSYMSMTAIQKDRDFHYVAGGDAKAPFFFIFIVKIINCMGLIDIILSIF